MPLQVKTGPWTSNPVYDLVVDSLIVVLLSRLSLSTKAKVAFSESCKDYLGLRVLARALLGTLPLVKASRMVLGLPSLTHHDKK